MCFIFILFLQYEEEVREKEIWFCFTRDFGRRKKKANLVVNERRKRKREKKNR